MRVQLGPADRARVPRTTGVLSSKQTSPFVRRVTMECVLVLDQTEGRESGCGLCLVQPGACRG